MSDPNTPGDSTDPAVQRPEEQATEAYEAPKLQPLNEESEGDFWCD